MLIRCVCTGKMPAIAALAYHRASGRAAAQPNQRLSYAENFLYMLDAGATPRRATSQLCKLCLSFALCKGCHGVNSM